MKNQNDKSSKVSNSSEYAVGSIVFEKFEIISFVASGGNGRVYKAKDIPRNIEVALKVLLVQSQDEKALVRFQSEAKTASRLKHQNIATIYDFGLSPTGTPYLSMEFVAGQSLEIILGESKSLALEEFLDIFIQISDALIHAHNNGVIHRDLKPANVIVNREADGQLIAKILDFGVAKLIDRRAEEEGRLTPTGNIVGSPLYMSPEQGQGGHTTMQSDVYSLGVMMFRCLTGKPPFHGETAIETIFKHQNSPAPKLADNVAPDSVPEELCALVDHMLSKDPLQRPLLEQEILPVLIATLEEIEARPEQDRPKPNPAQAIATIGDITQWKPNYPIIIGVLVALLIVGGIVVYAISQTNRKEPAETRKLRIDDWHVFQDFKEPPKTTVVDNFLEDPTTDDDLKGYKDDKKSLDLKYCRVTDEGLLQLGKPKKLEFLTLSSTPGISKLTAIPNFENLVLLKLEGTNVDDAAVERLLGLKHLTNVDLGGTRITDDALKTLGEIKTLTSVGISNLKLSPQSIIDGLKPLHSLKALEIKRHERLTVEDLKLIIADHPVLNYIDVQNCFEILEPELDLLKSKYPDIIFPPKNSMIIELRTKAEKGYQDGNYVESAKLVKRIITILQRVYGDRSPRLLEYYCLLGNIELRLRHHKESEDAFQKALICASEAHDPGSQLLVEDAIALALTSWGRENESEPHMLRAYKLAKQLTTPAELWQRDIDVGNHFRRKEDCRNAAHYFQDAINIEKSMHSPPGIDSALLHASLGDMQRTLHQEAKARVNYLIAIKTFQSYEPQDAEQAATYVMSAVATADFDQRAGDLESSLKYNEIALRGARSKKCPKLFLRIALSQRWDLYKRLGRPQEEIDKIDKEVQSIKLTK